MMVTFTRTTSTIKLHEKLDATGTAYDDSPSNLGSRTIHRTDYEVGHVEHVIVKEQDGKGFLRHLKLSEGRTLPVHENSFQVEGKLRHMLYLYKIHVLQQSK